MKPYVKTYLTFFGYSLGPDQDFIPCEVCEVKTVDVHHIESRGMGGTRDERINQIENLMALCRTCHDKYGDKVQWVDYLKEKHRLVLLKSKHDNEKSIYYSDPDLAGILLRRRDNEIQS